MYFPTKKAFTNRKYLLKLIKNKKPLDDGFNLKNRKQNSTFHCRLLIFFVNDNAYYVEYLWRKTYHEFSSVGKIHCLCEARKNCYPRNKTPMAAFAWAIGRLLVDHFSTQLKEPTYIKLRIRHSSFDLLLQLTWRTKRVFRSDK